LVADFAFAERDRHLQRADERARRTALFRWQLADALQGVDSPDALPILSRLLELDDASVRLSAARALLGQSSPQAADLLARALALDFGEEDGVSRNPEVHAALLRALVTEFAGHPVTRVTLADERRFDEPSVALMVLAARSTPAPPAAPRGPSSSGRSPS
jgi:HEAT repeat protein